MKAKEIIRKFMSENGKKGGKATGKAKRRGSKAYYKKLSKLAHEAKKK